MIGWFRKKGRIILLKAFDQRSNLAKCFDQRDEIIKNKKEFHFVMLQLKLSQHPLVKYPRGLNDNFY